MWTWVRRVGLVIMVVSSIFISLPIVQYEICSLNLGANDEIVSVKHCYYDISRVGILVLLFGNILFGIGYYLERMHKNH